MMREIGRPPGRLHPEGLVEFVGRQREDALDVGHREMPGGDAAVVPQDGPESEQRAATQTLARFGSLCDVPALGLSERCGREGGGEACRYMGGDQCDRRYRGVG